MPWVRPETCVGQHGMPRTLPVRPGPLRTWPRTNLVRPPMRSRPHVLARRKARARARPQGALSASGSASSCRRRFASSYLMTSGCETPSAGQCSTAERVGPPAPPTSPSFSGSDQLLNSGAVRPTGLTDRAQRGRATCDRGRRRGGDGSPAARIAVRQCGQLVGEVGERCDVGLVVDVAPVLDAGDQGRPVQDLQAVSYTHLTLPTKRIV